MIRWNYTLPRLLMLGAVSLFVCFALDPLMHFAICSRGQRMTGAHVDIQQFMSSLPNSTVRMDGVQIADPNHPETNLISAERILLKLNPHALLRRRYVIEEGQATGLQICGLRTASGQLAEDDQKNSDNLDNAIFQLLDVLAGRADQAFDSLETVLLSRELSQRWPVEYDAVEARARRLLNDIKQLEELVQTTRYNPLRELERPHAAVQQFERISTTTSELRSELKRLDSQIHADHLAMDDARRNDAERIRERLQFRPFDGDALAENLLGRQWASRISAVTSWVERIRALIPDMVVTPADPRRRGEDIALAAVDDHPDVIVRRLFVEGTAMVGDRSVPFAGIANDVSSHPSRQARPAVIRLLTSGGINARIHASVDDTKGPTTTDVVMDCPQLDQPTMKLKESDSLSVTVAPGAAHLWSHITMSDEGQIDGRIIYKRDDVKLQPSFGASYSNRLLSHRWQDMFEGVQNLHAVVFVSGRLEEPKCRIKTNLGPQLATGVNAAMRDELDARRTQLTNKLERESSADMAQLTAMIEQRRASILKQLELNDNALQQIERRLDPALTTPEIGRTRLSRTRLK